jgi:hypothetical protein
MLSLTPSDALPGEGLSHFECGFVAIYAALLTGEIAPCENRYLERNAHGDYKLQPFPLAGNHT